MNSKIDDQGLFTVPQTARRWGVSEALVWKALREGAVESVQLGRARRIRAVIVARVEREGFPSLTGECRGVANA